MRLVNSFRTLCAELIAVSSARFKFHNYLTRSQFFPSSRVVLDSSTHFPHFTSSHRMAVVTSHSVYHDLSYPYTQSRIVHIFHAWNLHSKSTTFVNS